MASYYCGCEPVPLIGKAFIFFPLPVATAHGLCIYPSATFKTIPYNSSQSQLYRLSMIIIDSCRFSMIIQYNSCGCSWETIIKTASNFLRSFVDQGPGFILSSVAFNNWRTDKDIGKISCWAATAQLEISDCNTRAEKIRKEEKQWHTSWFLLSNWAWAWTNPCENMWKTEFQNEPSAALHMSCVLKPAANDRLGLQNVCGL